MARSITALLRLWRNTKGQITVITAIIGLPLLLICGYALDLNRTIAQKTNLGAALDAAALAAVIPANLTDSQRSQFAQEIFEENYVSKRPVDLDIAASRETVKITGKSHVNTVLSSFAGLQSIAFAKTSHAVLTRANVVCVLALAKSGSATIEFKDKMTFNSPACSVQANSSDPYAIQASTPNAPIAKSFCSAGGSQGTFIPLIKNNCTPVKDPFADKTPPPVPDTPCIKPTYKGAAVLRPGVYCDGLKIDNANVIFKPGIYHIWGEAIFTGSSVAMGKEVTLILRGTGNGIKLDNSAMVKFKAPANGPTAGIVFWQVYANKDDPNAKPPSGISGKSEISASGGLNLVGAAYFPTHELTITSDRWAKARSPATSFIANRILFAGIGNVEVHVNHEAGGIPPILPRSDDGARLVE